MTSRDTLQQGVEFIEPQPAAASGEQPAQKTAISTSPLTVSDTPQTHSLRSSAGIVPISEGGEGVSREPQLCEPPEPENHRITKSETQEITQAHLREQGDSHVNNLVESDGYQSMTLDVSKRNA
jgi:hypothetical protein